MDRYSKFTILVNRIVRSIHRIKSEATAKLGLKGTHVSCLYYLYNSENPLTASELCEVCDEDKAAVSRAIDFLGKEGYVVCDGAGAKRYRTPVVLTVKGVEAGRQLTERAQRAIEEASAGLSEEDRTILYRSLDLISENLQKACNADGDGNGG